MSDSVDHEDHNVDATSKPPDIDNLDPAASINGGSSTNGSVYDPDAQQMVITSLRGQIQDLVSQVSQLNNKLVKSYDRVSDLEDELHVSSAQLRTNSLKISQLELERSQHISALSTGLLVEKSHVTNELTRLMEKATEEAAQRGQAESARVEIEKELDDLSANLFNQANTMVAEARYARHLSERKTEEAEKALKSAEEAVGVMQQQMQALREDKEVAEKKAQEMQVSMGKGKWIETQQDGTNITRTLRLLSSHTPYQEFMFFVAHLRSVHMSTPQPPQMSTLLTLPYLQRLCTEDSEPTVRIDQAYSLNWLSRRSVLTAIYSGQLVIEPLSLGAILSESIAGMNASGNDLPCALCGVPIFPKDEILQSLPTLPPSLSRNNGAWSNSLFKKSQGNPYSGSAPSTPRRSLSFDPRQNFIFRVAVSQTTTSIPIPALPIQSSGAPASQYTASPSNSSTVYPLCRGGWCLSRLRTTCQLWSFVRTGIVEKVWEEELPAVLPPPPRIPVPAEASKPPIPPRRKGFWGMASALGEKAATWSEAAKKISPSIQPEQQPSSQPPPLPSQESQDTVRKVSREKENQAIPMLPHPPPTHPAIAAIHGAGPPPSKTEPASSSSLAPPPPVPRRSEGRSRAKSPSPQPPKRRQPPPEAQETVHDTPQEEAITSSSSPASPTKTGQEPAQSSPTVPPPIPLRAAGHKRHSSLLPERIPLPDSRPGTPGPPSRPSSPAPGGAASGAGGAPPPIPRRAAARASRLTAGATSEPMSRPDTPPVHATPVMVTVAEAVEKDDTKARQSVGQETAQSPEAVKEMESNAEPIQAKEEEKGPHATVNCSSPSESDKPESTDTPAQMYTTETSPEVTEPEPVPKPIEGLASNGKGAQEVQTNGHVASDGGADTDALHKTLCGSSKVSAFDSNESNGVDVNGRVPSIGEQQETEEKEVFVGDATWEERTWKELARLREDMFWARIGGLR